MFVFCCLLSDWDDECLAVIGPVDGGDGPSDADTQEDVDGVTSRHVTDRRVGVLILSGRHFTGEHVCSIGCFVPRVGVDDCQKMEEKWKRKRKQVHNRVSSSSMIAI